MLYGLNDPVQVLTTLEDRLEAAKQLKEIEKATSNLVLAVFVEMAHLLHPPLPTLLLGNRWPEIKHDHYANRLARLHNYSHFFSQVKEIGFFAP